MRALVGAFALAIVVVVCALRCAYLLTKLMVQLLILIYRLGELAYLHLPRSSHAR
jgi:hypothetical protein